MIHADPILHQMVTALAGDCEIAGLIRQRGGIARGVAWVEVSGRGADGAWYEMRLHHRANEKRIDGAMLVYQPIIAGGRTIELFKATLIYYPDPSAAQAEIIRLALKALSMLPRKPATQE
jgi:hypothetical protein